MSWQADWLGESLEDINEWMVLNDEGVAIAQMIPDEQTARLMAAAPDLRTAAHKTMAAIARLLADVPVLRSKRQELVEAHDVLVRALRKAMSGEEARVA